MFRNIEKFFEKKLRCRASKVEGVSCPKCSSFNLELKRREFLKRGSYGGAVFHLEYKCLDCETELETTRELLVTLR